MRKPAADRRHLAHQIENRSFLLLHFLVGGVEFELIVPERLLPFVDLAALRFERFGELLQIQPLGFERLAYLLELRLKICLIGRERFELFGHLRELLTGVLLPLAGRLQGRPRLHEFVFALLPLRGKCVEVGPARGQFVLTLGEVAGDIIKLKLRIVAHGVEFRSLRVMRVVFLDRIRETQFREPLRMFLVGAGAACALTLRNRFSTSSTMSVTRRRF